MTNPVLIDIETDGQSPFVGRLLLNGWCLVGEPAQVIEARGISQVIEPEQLVGHPLLEYLADPLRPVVSMTKYDPRYLRLQGWDVQGPFYDIQVMAWVLNENQPLSLDALVGRYLHRKMDKRLRRSAGQVIFRCSDGTEVPLTEMTTDHAAWPEFVEYCRRDVEAESDLFLTLFEKLEDTSWSGYYLEEEVPFTEVLLGMECSGLPVNLEDSEALREELEVVHEKLGRELLAEGNLPSSFNIGSGDQLASYLYYPVAELADSLNVGVDVAACLKSCLAGEHEDCGSELDVRPVETEQLPEGRVRLLDTTPVDIHVRDLMPDGFTLRSVGREQVHGVWTFKGRGITPTEKTPSEKRWATSTPVLKSNIAAAQDPWCLKLFEYRKTDKALTTYLRKYPVLAWPPMRVEAEDEAPERAADPGRSASSRLYGRFNQTGTKTGRLSSSEPNLQNQPSHGELGERMRRLFQGNLIVGDYSQLEPRLMAHFSEDPRLLSVYREGRDVYLDLAHGIFGEQVGPEDDERGICKTLVLAMGYGAGPAKVGQILTINGFPTDEPTSRAYLEEMHRYYHRFFAWREAVIRRVKVRGYVTTIGGRHRRLKAAFLDRKNWKNVGYGERQAVNAIVQGSAGDIVRRTMVAWQGWEKCLQHLTLLAQVHDELVWEYSTEHFLPYHEGWPDYYLGLLKDVAENGHGYDLHVPLLFEPHVGDSWFAAKEGELELPEDMEAEETVAFAEEES